MPHLVLAGTPCLEDVAAGFAPQLERWGRAVLKTEACWLRQGHEGLLVEGVVVEFQRPLHPVALVAPRADQTVVRLWSVVPVERTGAVQRWLVLVAAEVQRNGGGGVVTSNLGDELLEGLELVSS